LLLSGLRMFLGFITLLPTMAEALVSVDPVPISPMDALLYQDLGRTKLGPDSGTDSQKPDDWYKLFVFVSLSMGDAALKSLYQEAQDYGALLVLRGLEDNSFKKTAETLQRLSISVQIEPELFQRYQVQRVPTFVYLRPQKVHILAGHTSLHYALSRFKAEG
jgi:type-F conjugative transfer system pilin assembly protein TrbC